MVLTNVNSVNSSTTLSPKVSHHKVHSQRDKRLWQTSFHLKKKTNHLASKLFATQLQSMEKLHTFMKMQICEKLNVYVSSMLKPIIKEQHKVLKSLPLLPVGVD